MSSILTNVFDSLFRRAQPRPATPRPRRTTLRVESLEDRRVMSTSMSAFISCENADSPGVMSRVGGDALVFDTVDSETRARASRLDGGLGEDLEDAGRFVYVYMTTTGPTPAIGDGSVRLVGYSISSPSPSPVTQADDVWVEGKIITGQNYDSAASDDNNHGTHVAGTVGSANTRINPDRLVLQIWT